MRRAAVAVLLLVAGEAAAQYPPVVTRSRLDPSRGVNFHAILLPDTVYVGQQATYQIGVFLNQEVRQRLRRNPEFVPPETRSLLVYDLPDARTPLVGNIDGRPYEVHVFQRAFFALAPGRYAVPSSRLTYALPQTASFFSREETHTMRSEALTLTVLPVPTAGRPDDWAGAVGEWRTTLRVDSASGRVGDPLVVTLRVEGRGNVSLLPRPRLAVDWATAVAADERVELDSTPSTLRGAKEFDWLLTPHQAGRRSVPPQRYAFFNPVARRFEIAWSTPAAVAVAEGDAVAVDSSALPLSVEADSVAPTAPLTLRPSMGNASSWSWLRAPWYLALLLLTPVPALAGAFRHRRRRPRRALTHGERLKAAASNATDVATVRRLAHDALRDRLQFDIGLALAEGTLVPRLRHEGITAETAARAEQLLLRMDAAVFGGSTASGAPTAAELFTLLRSVEAEARRSRSASPSRAASRILTTVLLAWLATAATLFARQGSDEARSWAAGHTAFAGGEYGKATRHFLDVARLHPDHPDVWANVGTAAWMAADTAHAVQGWQRALRRAPLDAELRSRLAQVRAVQDRGLAAVPHVPIVLPPVLLLLAWGAAWAHLARRAWRARPILRHVIWVVVGGGLLGAWALRLDDRQRARELVVVTRPEPLRILPVLGADQGPAPLTGEVAQVLQRRGAWARVRLDGDRDGWVAAELLLPLGDD